MSLKKTCPPCMASETPHNPKVSTNPRCRSGNSAIQISPAAQRVLPPFPRAARPPAVPSVEYAAPPMVRKSFAPATDLQRRVLHTTEQAGRAANTATAPTTHAPATGRGLHPKIWSTCSAVPLGPPFLRWMMGVHRWASRRRHCCDHCTGASARGCHADEPHIP